MEVYINGEWGTVCGFSWDPLDSKVVCQQLGYNGVNRTYSSTWQHNFGEGTGQSWLRDLRCTGSEANLLRCPHGGVGSGCPHFYDVGVACTNEDLPDKGGYMCACLLHHSEFSHEKVKKGFDRFSATSNFLRNCIHLLN